MKSFFILLLCLFFSISSVIWADYFHNINGFYGERAQGLGGAYTAIADDPSGAYYNPAGLAFTYNDAISISASNYRMVKKEYKNVDSPGTTYSQDSRNYMPNFIGFVKGTESFKYAFSIVNTLNESFSRNDQITIPVFSPTINNTKIYNLENYNQLLFGPSLAKSFGDKFSIGATLYYMEDTKQINKTQLQQYTDYSYVSKSYIDNRRTVGFQPILGLQYMPAAKMSIGLTYKQILVTGANRLYNEYYLDSSKAGTINNTDFLEGTHKRYTSYESGVTYSKQPLTGKIPQIYELRAGFAYFYDSKTTASFDIIYHSGSMKQQNQSEYATNYKAVSYIWNKSDNLELYRKATTNFAFGFERYITDNLSMSMGYYTNFANTDNITWKKSLMELYIINNYGKSVTASLDSNTSIKINLPSVRTNPNNEHVNNRGLSLGFSFSTSSASIAFTYIKETGYGQSRIDQNSLSQQLVYNSSSFYIVATSKN